jgi:hypothetical protein
MEEYLTAKELSKRIKMADGTIRNLVCKGVFIKGRHYVKPTPRKLLFIWSGIEAWLHSTSDCRSAMAGGNGNCLINI